MCGCQQEGGRGGGPSREPLPSLLPADGGVDLQPPDAALPAFLPRKHNAWVHYQPIPLGAQFRTTALPKTHAEELQEPERVIELFFSCPCMNAFVFIEIADETRTSERER